MEAPCFHATSIPKKFTVDVLVIMIIRALDGAAPSRDRCSPPTERTEARPTRLTYVVRRQKLARMSKRRLVKAKVMAMAISTFMLLATAPKSALAANPTPNPTYCDAPIALGYGCGDESITGHNWFNLYFDTAADCQEEWLSYDCSENSDDESTSDTTFIWSDYDSGGDGNCGCTGLTAYDSSCTDTFDDKVFMYEYCAPSPTSIPTSSVPTTLTKRRWKKQKKNNCA